MKWTCVVAACLTLAAASALAGDYAAGEKIAKERCDACHGPGGGKPLAPDYPILSGQYFDYLEHALHAYKSGKRNNPLMSPQAQGLSDEEIENLAWYFFKQRGLASKY